MEGHFTKKDTNIVKGIAILAMVFHHIYPNNTALSINLENFSWLEQMAASGKICVALLTILSGFGLMESYKKSERSAKLYPIRFVLSHYIQLLSLYWIVWCFSIVAITIEGSSIWNVYGTGKVGIINLIIDLLGLGIVFHSPVWIGGWYLSAIVVFYCLFPILEWIVSKVGIVICIISYLPWIYYQTKGDLMMHTDWWLFYLCPFVLGIWLSQKDMLAHEKEKVETKRTIVVVALFVLILVLRQYGTLIIDPFLSLSVILLEVHVASKVVKISEVLSEFGKESANIWLLHPFIISQISVYSFRNYQVKFLAVLFLSFLIAICLSKIKNGISYNKIVGKIRNVILPKKV